jgi:hypothetical protein
MITMIYHEQTLQTLSVCQKKNVKSECDDSKGKFHGPCCHHWLFHNKGLHESYFCELKSAIKAPKEGTCYTSDKLYMSRLIFLAEGESKVRFEKDLAIQSS